MATVRTNQLNGAAIATAGLVPFVASALSGVEGTTWTGMLPDEWRRRYEADGPNVVYTVRSYGTPIAWAVRVWVTPGTAGVRWVVPPVKYSRTTSRHQGYVRRAIVKRGAVMIEDVAA